MALSRRRFLRGTSVRGALIRIGLPPLEEMFNGNGTAYAAPAPGHAPGVGQIETRFLIWFNGNGIPERYWIPTSTGANFDLTPCLAPLEPVQEYIHVLSGVDNPAARIPGPGNGHVNSMSGLMTCTAYTGRGAGGPSFDQVLAGRIGNKSRFGSIQVGVAQESHGENMHRNMSWAGYDRALPPEMIPQNCFDRLFGVRNETWTNRKKSILDAVLEDASEVEAGLSLVKRTGTGLTSILLRFGILSAPLARCRRIMARISNLRRMSRI